MRTPDMHQRGETLIYLKWDTADADAVIINNYRYPFLSKTAETREGDKNKLWQDFHSSLSVISGNSFVFSSILCDTSGLGAGRWGSGGGPSASTFSKHQLMMHTHLSFPFCTSCYN